MSLESIRAKRMMEATRKKIKNRKTALQYAKEFNETLLGKEYTSETLHHIDLLQIYGQLRVIEDLLND